MALEEFYDDNCVEAEPAFREVSKKYPYSRFAALADLRAADCKIKQEQYADGIASYQDFIRRRPTHPEVPYARLKIAEAHFAQIPGEWLLSPPAHQKDQVDTQSALQSLRGFIKRYPKDGRVKLARTMERKALSLLAQHELYAARFYLRRDRPTAAIMRLEGIRKNFRGAFIEPEALYMLVELYQEHKSYDLAKQVFQDLNKRYPRSSWTRKANGVLRQYS